MDKKDMEKTNNIIDVVIYARFSSLRQNETSIEAQLKECYKYCEAMHFRVKMMLRVQKRMIDLIFKD